MADHLYLTVDTIGDLPTWHKNYPWEEVFGEHVQDGIEYLRSELGVKSVVAYGYCLGAWVGARQSALSDPVIKGAVPFHPSCGFENDYNREGAVGKLTERISVPQVLMPTGNDPDFVRENGSVSQILAANPAISELSKVIDFSDMVHSWVNRGSLSDPATAAAVAKAWHEAITFFYKVIPQQRYERARLCLFREKKVLFGVRHTGLRYYNVV
ncbi:putative hydrolase, partial [Globisporangium splendens]